VNVSKLESFQEGDHALVPSRRRARLDSRRTVAGWSWYPIWRERGKTSCLVSASSCSKNGIL